MEGFFNARFRVYIDSLMPDCCGPSQADINQLNQSNSLTTATTTTTNNNNYYYHYHHNFYKVVASWQSLYNL